MATIRLVPSVSAVSNSSYASISNASNMYTNTDSTTHGTFTHNRASTNNTYYGYLRGFNFDDVPSQAVVSGFTIKIKASATGHTTSTSSSYYMGLVNGTTQIGSTSASGRLSTTVTTFTFAEGSLTWETITGYGSNFGIRIPMRRASSNTADVVSVYGAEIEVTYTVPNPRTVTTTLTGDGTISPSGTQTMYDGDEYELTITPTDKSATVTVTKNGTDVSSELVAHGAGSTVSLVPADVTTSGIQSGSSYAQYAVGHSAESPSSSGASSNMYASNYSTGYAEYSFDFSAIPSNAAIDSVEVRCYGHRESSTISSTYVSQCVLYSGSTAISDEVDFPSTANTLITLAPSGTVTRSQLDSFTVRHYVGYYGGLVLGITVEVTYATGSGLDHYTYTTTISGNMTIAVTIGGAVQTDTLYVKNSGAWVAVSKAFKKVNGAWTEISVSTAFDTNTKYVRGN